MTTPVRAGVSTPGALTTIRDAEIGYADGAEESVLELLQQARDLSSLSDELASIGRTWGERYHLSPARANVVRALRLDADATVLEIGAGCGAVTRYLGETCAVVDAVEPVPSRARAARERTRDLDNVEVFVGLLEDVPAEPAYDVVVVVGVLEYVANGSSAREPYLAFLRQVAERLRPGGSLVLAIENKLGVKYWVGSPEDHTDRAFDSVEGYPYGGKARTFDRGALEGLVREVGLDPRTLAAFPDYKMTRTVLDPARLTGGARSLLHRIPSFPSPDWGTPRVPLADERRAWTSLVEAGLGGETGNSFVVVAGKGGPSTLWGEADAGAYYSAGRRSAYAVGTRLEVDGDSVLLHRARLGTGGDPDLEVKTGVAPFVEGRDFTEVVVDLADERTAAILTRWRDLVLAAGDEAEVSLDLVPHNLVVGGGDELRVIDDEWRATGTTAERVVQRGVLTLALRLAAAGRPVGAWAGCSTWADVAQQTGDHLGLTGAWLDRAIQDEAELQARVAAASRGIEAEVASIRAALALPLVPQGAVDHHFVARYAALEARDAEHERFIAQLTADIESLTATVAHRDRDVAEVLGVAESRRRSLEQVREELGAVRLMLGEAERDLAVERRARTDAEGQVSALRAELEALRATISWKVTAPLRAVRRLPDRGPKPAVPAVPTAAVPAEATSTGRRGAEREDLFLPDRPATIQIQSVLYRTPLDGVRRSVEGLAQSVRVAQGSGTVGRAVLVYGDASPEPTLSEVDLDEVRALAGDAVEIRYQFFGENLGFARGNNVLAAQADTDFLLLLNPDVVVSSRLVSTLVGGFAAPGTGMTEAKQLPFEHPKDYEPGSGRTGWVAGACFVIPTALFAELGGFDTEAFFMYCEDVDLSWRVQLAGLDTVFRPDAVAVHDKRLDQSGGWQPTESEHYYSAEAALMLAHKWSRPDVVERILADFDAHGADHHRRAAAEYRARAREGRLPVPVDPANEVGYFEGGTYTPHRFVV
jgi:GT2 family glycosyltransferase/SAM-dependent methyltransferase